MREYKIASIPGDGIGPEVIQAGLEVLEILAELDGGFRLKVTDFDWGSDYYKKNGVMMPPGGHEQLRGYDAIYFGAVEKEFLAGANHAIEAACFGIAGPIVEGRVKTTNLPWIVDSNELRRVLKVDSIHLLNDLEAAAYGILTLEEEEFFTLNEGELRDVGNKALIAAGTGLGQAILYDDGHHFRPLATEAGHADFAPRDELEIALLRHLIGRFGHVSYERILSGPGLFNIYRFLKEAQGMAEPPALSERLSTAEDDSAVISKAGLAGEFEICVKALDLFVSLYGAEAGNLALRAKSLRGLYVGGGIAPKILAKLKDGTFMRAFADKGRYAGLLGAIPVHVVLNEQAALHGAASYAAFLSGD